MHNIETDDLGREEWRALKFFKHVVIIFTNGLSQRGLLLHKMAVMATVTSLKMVRLLAARLSLQPQIISLGGGN